jgi:hypothetical protein
MTEVFYLSLACLLLPADVSSDMMMMTLYSLFLSLSPLENKL